MEIKQETRGNVKVVGLCGRLDANSSQAVEKQLQAFMDQGEERLVLDLTELTYISSLGLRVFIAVAKSVRNVNGKLALAGLNNHIYEIFKIARFTNIFSIYRSCEEAVAYCAD
ncbi:MAG TPA: STAS domain-containing protein [Candidatus Acidoferrum sp.]|nr:STAS domain-containing protein [Candidatus Acidoferrum sp.]